MKERKSFPVNVVLDIVFVVAIFAVLLAYSKRDSVHRDTLINGLITRQGALHQFVADLKTLMVSPIKSTNGKPVKVAEVLKVLDQDVKNTNDVLFFRHAIQYEAGAKPVLSPSAIKALHDLAESDEQGLLSAIAKGETSP